MVTSSLVRLRAFARARAYYFLLFLYLFHTVLFTACSVGIPGRIHVYTNSSGSMEPSAPAGSASLVLIQDPFSYEAGDIIAFRTDHETVIHRLQGVRGNRYVTKGDRNDAIDPGLLDPRRVIGKAVLTVPFAGAWISFMKGPFGSALFLVLPAVFFIVTEVAFVLLPYRRRLSRRKGGAV
jgi:signal peptidase